MTLIIFLLMSFSLWAQEFQYRLEGSFTSNATIVNYTLNWNETSNTIQGLYHDNSLAVSGPKIMTGNITPAGRSMKVILPEEVLGVRAITLETPITGSTSGLIPVRAITQDSLERTISNSNILSTMTSVATTNSGGSSSGCMVGFGALAGLCGIYNGSFNEFSDPNNLCDLQMIGNMRMALTTESNFEIYLNYNAGMPVQSYHRIGAFLPSPQAKAVNITGRNCSALEGTNMNPNNCKTLSLYGVFHDRAGTIFFNGTYSITDELTGFSCVYNMSLNRESTL